LPVSASASVWVEEGRGSGISLWHGQRNIPGAASVHAAARWWTRAGAVGAARGLRPGVDAGYSKTSSAARGGPQLEIRARILTPNVLAGRTVTMRVPSSPRAAQVTATARF